MVSNYKIILPKKEIQNSANHLASLKFIGCLIPLSISQRNQEFGFGNQYMKKQIWSLKNKKFTKRQSLVTKLVVALSYKLI